MKTKLLSVLIAMLSITVAAETWYVSENGAGDGSEGNPMAFTGAVAAAKDGDTILLAAGTHSFAEIVTISNAVTIKGESRANTFIKPAATFRLHIKHADAMLEEVDIKGATTYGLQLDAGNLKNVTISDAVVGGSRPFYMTGGYADGIIVTNCTASSWDGRAGGLITGGVITNSYIVNNKCTISGQRTGAGIEMRGGVLTHSVIANNTAKGDDNACPGITINGGLVNYCVITNNNAGAGSSNPSAGGIYVYGGSPQIKNCLIQGNTIAYGYPGGIFCKSTATFENCTIVGNKSSKSTVDGVRLDSGTMNYCLIWDNADTPDAINLSAKSGTKITYTCAPEASSGDGNVTATPLFADAQNGDYRHAYGSAAIDASPEVTSSPVDILGNPRARTYSGKNDTPYDLGCYEYVLPAGQDFGFAVTTAAESYPMGTAVVFTLITETELSEATYSFLNVNTGSLATHTETVSPNAAYSHEFAAGEYSVSIEAVGAKGGAASYSLPYTIKVQPSHTYISSKGKHIYPYNTEVNASTNLQDAIDATYATVENPGIVSILPGTHVIAKEASPIGTAVGNTERYLAVVSTPLTIQGESEETTVICAEGVRGIYICHDNAMIQNLAITNTKDRAIHLVKGHAKNLTLRDNFMSSQNAGVLTLSGGIAERMTITNNVIGRYAWDERAVYISGGVLQDSFVGANNGEGRGRRCAPGVHLKSGALLRTTIAKNMGPVDDASPGLLLEGGTVDSCIISCNTNTTASNNPGPAGIYVRGGSPIVRNTLVIDNISEANQDGCQGGIYCKSTATFDSNTMIGNFNTANSAYSGICMTSGTIINSIIWGNGDTDVNLRKNSSVKVTYTCSQETIEGDGNTSEEPRFVRGTYKPSRYAAHLCNAGLAQSWMQDATDLAGKPRISGYAPDLGAYENNTKPTVMTLQ